jgi:hypothetical protein
MQPLTIMAIFIIGFPAAFSVLAYFVTRDTRIFYVHKIPIVALLSYLAVMSYGLTDVYRLFYSGRPTDEPQGYLLRVARAYLAVPVVVGLAYYLCPVLQIAPPWPALPLGALAYWYVRKHLRSPIKAEQYARR